MVPAESPPVCIASVYSRDHAGRNRFGMASLYAVMSERLGGSGWSPLRFPAFRRWWFANLTSNVGSWMQTVAAQWLMLSLTTSAVYVTLVQTAAGLPVVLFAVLAGTIGDLVDRRRFLLVTEAVMLVAAAALGVLALAGLVTPWVRRSGPAGPDPRTGRPGAPARGHALADA